ncbi:MAG: hypothetical protein PHS49_03655 [Candidatus Gracilibacteria bacterium]|nr:hypothetical protein [Candidatus Gracilibacteria bacterium]
MKFTKKLILSFIASSICSFSGVFAAGIDHFEVKFTPDTAKVGESLDLEIEAVDKNNEVVTDYNGTILIFSESDPEAELPSQLEENTYTFKAADQGKIKFENSVIFKSPGTQDIHIYDLNDDTVLGVAEADISEDTTVKSLDISIISPEDGLTIGENSINVSGLTQKNYKVKIIVNGKDEFSTASNNDGIYEKTIDKLQDGENKIKAQVLDANDKVIGESKEVKIKISLGALSIKSVKVNPESVDPESSYEIEMLANPDLVEASIIINDTIAKLTQTKAGVYTTKILSPKEPGIYKIDAKIKDELGHEKTELGAASLTVNELKLNAATEAIETNTGVVETNTGKVCDPNKEYPITGLKLVELKTKSILTWDKIDGVESYNVYKKLENGDLELIQNVSDAKFEVEITGEEIKYDYFSIKAVAQNNCGQVYEGNLSDATKVKTGPELIILLLLSLFIGGFVYKSIRNNA